MAPLSLFKKKENKMKKGVRAIVLCSTAASLPAQPSLFTFLPLNPALKQRFERFIPAQTTAADAEIPLTGRRAQSMSILPSQPSTLAAAADDDDFAAFEQEASQFEAHRSGLLLALEQSATAPPVSKAQDRYIGTNGGLAGNRYPGLGTQSPAKTPAQGKQPMLNRTQPHHPQRCRRVQSAPSVALTHLPPNLLDEMDSWEDDFTLNEWVVPQVREKAQRQQQPRADIEDWDQDFEVEQDEQVEVPVYLEAIQDKFKIDMLQMRQFALHIQDLKVIHENALALEKSLAKHYEDDVSFLKADGEEMMSQIQLLMHLADFQEDASQSNLSQDELAQLSKMIQAPDQAPSETIQFGETVMKQLLDKISPLKRELVGYVSQLRDLMTI
ncbi:hypothetical protein HDV03_000724 [Kappamyces sp. JEL0829]|nr:hypothetical protein HDV03_000724 [Kappamyces sp. JEL0829]